MATPCPFRLNSHTLERSLPCRYSFKSPSLGKLDLQNDRSFIRQRSLSIITVKLVLHQKTVWDYREWGLEGQETGSQFHELLQVLGSDPSSGTNKPETTLWTSLLVSLLACKMGIIIALGAESSMEMTGDDVCDGCTPSLMPRAAPRTVCDCCDLQLSSPRRGCTVAAFTQFGKMGLNRYTWSPGKAQLRGTLACCLMPACSWILPSSVTVKGRGRRNLAEGLCTPHLILPSRLRPLPAAWDCFHLRWAVTPPGACGVQKKGMGRGRWDTNWYPCDHPLPGHQRQGPISGETCSCHIPDLENSSISSSRNALRRLAPEALPQSRRTASQPTRCTFPLLFSHWVVPVGPQQEHGKKVSQF